MKSGDIISDLGAAPDIAGLNVASPLATILSGSMLLQWLADRVGDKDLAEASGRIDMAIHQVMAKADFLTRDLGGTASCSEVRAAICRALTDWAPALLSCRFTDA